MAGWSMTRLNAVIVLFFLTVLFLGCAGGQTVQQEVTTEYLLIKAGFDRWDVNMETPKRQALLNNLPRGKIVTYLRNGEVYHAYADEGSSNLYIGDETAYQKYLSLARDRQICERVQGANQVEFWGCMDEYQQRGGGPRGR